MSDGEVNSHGEFINKQENPSINMNGKVFGFAMLFTQILVCFMYGFFVEFDPTLNATTNLFSDISLLLPFFYIILTVIGFGLIFAYLKHLVWSGIGFNLLITMFSIQLYPLINAFWFRTGLFSSGNFLGQKIKLYLHNGIVGATGHGDSITSAILCGLSLSVGFSCILGRAGPLEAYIFSIIGIIGFDLNRIITNNFGIDGFGTMQIFIYGGFLGLAASLILRCRQKGVKSTAMHRNYTSNRFSSQIALVGTLIIFAMLPTLSLEFNTRIAAAATGTFVIPQSYIQINILQALFASTISSVFTSLFINGRLNIRDMVYGPIAGGIAGGTASFYILNPAYALTIGFFSGCLQVIGQSLFQRKFLKGQSSIFSTISFLLFGIQGIMGAAFTSALNAIIISQNDTGRFNFNDLDPAQNSFYIGLISAGIGIVFGLIIGIAIYFVNGHQRQEYFTDSTYWFINDGIRLIQELPEKSEAVYSSDEEAEVRSGSQIKNSHAYL